jgi:cytochrome bd-type quinol oxidase subunit 2
MAEVVEKKGQYLSGPDRQPLDDMRDGKDIRQWPEPLGTVISHIHTTLFENYSGYDTESIEHQKRHKTCSILAVLFGSIAIEIAIIQVFLTAQRIEKFNEYLKIIELISFCLALLAVSIAVLSHWQKKWLKKRFMAEQYRSLKFRAFLQPDLYCKSDKVWEERLIQWRK